MKFLLTSALGVITVVGILTPQSTTAYAGEYNLNCKNLATGEEHEEEVTIHGPISGTYIVERTYGEEFDSEDGIEFRGMLFTYSVVTGSPLSVYIMKDTELYALMVTDDGEVTVKSTKGGCPLEITLADTALVGWYAAQGAADDGTIPYSDTMILEPEGELWKASHVQHTTGFEHMPGSIEPVGYGFSLGELLVLSYDSYLKVYIAEDQSLEGPWIVYYWDTGNNCAVITTGYERAQRVESDR